MNAVRAFAPGTVANLGPGLDILALALDGRGRHGARRARRRPRHHDREARAIPEISSRARAEHGRHRGRAGARARRRPGNRPHDRGREGPPALGRPGRQRRVGGGRGGRGQRASRLAAGESGSPRRLPRGGGSGGRAARRQRGGGALRRGGPRALARSSGRRAAAFSGGSPGRPGGAGATPAHRGLPRRASAVRGPRASLSRRRRTSVRSSPRSRGATTIFSAAPSRTGSRSWPGRRSCPALAKRKPRPSRPGRTAARSPARGQAHSLSPPAKKTGAASPTRWSPPTAAAELRRAPASARSTRAAPACWRRRNDRARPRRWPALLAALRPLREGASDPVAAEPVPRLRRAARGAAPAAVTDAGPTSEKLSPAGGEDRGCSTRQASGDFGSSFSLWAEDDVVTIRKGTRPLVARRRSRGLPASKSCSSSTRATTRPAPSRTAA